MLLTVAVGWREVGRARRLIAPPRQRGVEREDQPVRVAAVVGLIELGNIQPRPSGGPAHELGRTAARLLVDAKDWNRYPRPIVGFERIDAADRIDLLAAHDAALADNDKVPAGGVGRDPLQLCDLGSIARAGLLPEFAPESPMFFKIEIGFKELDAAERHDRDGIAGFNDSRNIRHSKPTRTGNGLWCDEHVEVSSTYCRKFSRLQHRCRRRAGNSCAVIHLS